MNRRSGWLWAGVVLAVAGCAAVALHPALDGLGEALVAATGLATSAVLWSTGRHHQRGLRGWRLLALAPLLPPLGVLLADLAGPADPLGTAVLRGLPTVPAYLVGIAGILTLVDRSRLRGAGARVAVELVLFLTACLVSVQLVVVGPGGSWFHLPLGQRLVLGAAVVATSATMAAVLTVLGVIEARRQPMAWVLLGGAALLALGHGLGTSALLESGTAASAVARPLVVGGLLLVCVAVLLDPGPCPATPSRPRSGRATVLRNVLPHLTMVGAMGLVGAVTVVLGTVPSPVTVSGLVACAVLAALHRCITVRDEQCMNARVRRSEAYFRSLVRSSGDAVLILDGALRVTWASPMLDRLLGAGAPPVVGRDLLALVHPADALPLGRALQPGADRGPGDDLVVLRLAHADGDWRDLEASVSDLRADADVGALVLSCRDVTERRARERVLEGVAFTDPTTGLPNRAGCDRVLVQRLGAAADLGRPASTLLLVEVDGLAEVREDAGRDLAATVLVELARRLRATVRADDLVARLAGDAFAVLTECDDSAADFLADRCLSAVEQPIATAAGIFDLTADVGLVPLTPGATVPELMARGENAVRAARRAGRGNARRYDPLLGQAAARRARLREDLPGAAARGELAVAFQPVISLEEQRITGVEALLRWRHPELGDVPPGEFVPIAERAGVVGELQRWALEHAARAAVSLPETGTPLRLGVNISASHVAARTLVSDVAAVLQCSGLGPERLVVEITEATLVADAEAIAVDVEALRLMGVHVALDDFGSGQSSLTHLDRLPIDVLKLDGALVARIDRDPRSRALCESMVTIGRALGVEVVAEGVETPAQLGVLRGLGCGFAQGFLLSRPLPLPELTELLHSGAGSLWPGLVGSR